MKLRPPQPMSVLLALILLDGLTPNNPSTCVEAYDTQSKSYYPKGTPPTHLYVIKDSSMNAINQELKATIATLQGLLAKNSGTQIWVDAEYGGYDTWLEHLSSEYGVTYENVPGDDPWWLLSQFSGSISGYIKYQHHSKGDSGDSANVATSLASYYNAIIVEEDLVAQAEAALGGTAGQMVFDATGLDESWLLQQSAYASHLSTHVTIEQRPVFYVQLRDYAVMASAFTFYDPNLSGTLRSQALQRLDPDSPVMGWADGDESAFVGLSSDMGRFVVPADHAHNLAPLSGIVEMSLTQVALDGYVVPPKETGKHYVTFVLSDGDNVQWLLGEHASDTQQRWWSNPNRGQFGVGYGVPPSLIDLAPSALKWYYNNATSNDVFMVGPSGGGYMYPSRYTEAELDLHLERLNDYMGRCDLGLVEVIDFGSLHNTELWDKYTFHENTDGIIYLEYSSHKAHEGKLRWSHGKPIITPRYIVSAGSEQEVIDAINAAPRDPSYPDAYSLVFVHSWSENLDHMKTVKDGLDASVDVVTPKAFVDLLKLNVLPDELSHDDFEAGLDASWTASGEVTANAAEPVEIGPGGYIEKTFSTSGHYSVRVEFDLAVVGLAAGDSVKVEFDNGSSVWDSILIMESDTVKADGNMYTFVHNLPTRVDDSSFKLRFSVVPFFRRLEQDRMLQTCSPAGDMSRECLGIRWWGIPRKCCEGLVCSGNICIADQTPDPTPSPTKSPVLPSDPPTPSPTSSPVTDSPTKRPSASPTKSPLQSPTSKPTTSPSKEPTKAPNTPQPTLSPVKLTPNPTQTPTRSPTSNPTKKPVETPQPTNSLSKSPTIVGLSALVDNVIVRGFPNTDTYGPWVFEAESSIFGHKMGAVSVDQDAWTASPSDGINDHMLFGPYTGLIPAGSRSATYRMKRSGCLETCGCGCIFCWCQTCSSACNAGDNVVILDINANTASGQEVVGSLQVKYGDFAEDDVYQDFNVPFLNGPDVITLEFRAFYQGTTTLTVDKITVQ